MGPVSRVSWRAHCILGFTPMCMPKISKRSKSFEVCEWSMSQSLSTSTTTESAIWHLRREFSNLEINKSNKLILTWHRPKCCRIERETRGYHAFHSENLCKVATIMGQKHVVQLCRHVMFPARNCQVKKRRNSWLNQKKPYMVFNPHRTFLKSSLVVVVTVDIVPKFDLFWGAWNFPKQAGPDFCTKPEPSETISCFFGCHSTPIPADSIAISRLYTSVSCVNTLQSMHSMIGNIFCSVFNLFQYCGLVLQVSSDNQHLGRFIFESACIPVK
jgi:hypothetical protein